MNEIIKGVNISTARTDELETLATTFPGYSLDRAIILRELRNRREAETRRQWEAQQRASDPLRDPKVIAAIAKLLERGQRENDPEYQWADRHTAEEQANRYRPETDEERAMRVTGVLMALVMDNGL